MRTRQRHTAQTLLAAVVLAALVGCATSGIPMTSAAPALSSERIAEILASPDRSAADRTNDLRRKPEAMLAFIGIHPGWTALDVSTGGGYTAELLARAIGPTGVVYGEAPPRDPNKAPPKPAAPEGEAVVPVSPQSPAAMTPSPAAATPPMPAPPRSSAQWLAQRQDRLTAAGVAAARIVYVPQPFDDPVPAALADGGLDLVTLMFNYHDFGYLGVDRARMNAAIFKALKPGGVYVLADHAGRPGTGISEAGTLHRIEDSFLRAEVEAAGFRLADKGDFLHNPNDPRDRNTPNPPQPKDEFVLKFVKP